MEWESIQERYRLMDWIDRRKPPAGGHELRVAAVKAPGGLIKASLLVDLAAKRIRRAFLTGDFFAYPERSVMDLEAQLKEASTEVTSLEQVLREHYAQGNQYIGVAVEDWLKLFEQAIYSAIPVTQD